MCCIPLRAVACRCVPLRAVACRCVPLHAALSSCRWVLGNGSCGETSWTTYRVAPPLAIGLSVAGASLTYHWLEGKARAWRSRPRDAFLVFIPSLGLVALGIAALMGPLNGALYCGTEIMGRCANGTGART